MIPNRGAKTPEKVSGREYQVARALDVTSVGAPLRRGRR